MAQIKASLVLMQGVCPNFYPTLQVSCATVVRQDISLKDCSGRK
jgi:hypothetical protein